MVDASSVEAAAGRVVADVGAFSRAAMAGYALRGYQLEPARAIVESVRLGLGRSFAIAFPGRRARTSCWRRCWRSCC